MPVGTLFPEIKVLQSPKQEDLQRPVIFSFYSLKSVEKTMGMRSYLLKEKTQNMNKNTLMS